MRKLFLISVSTFPLYFRRNHSLEPPIWIF